MKRSLVLLLAVGVLLGFSGVSNAFFGKIGTASYDSDEDGINEVYNLIYQDDGPFGPITWLDYSNTLDSWYIQAHWTSGLGEYLEVSLNPGYTTDIDWETGWRLPLVDESQANLDGGSGYEGPDGSGYHNYELGYNMVNGEMGYLFYELLGNNGKVAIDGTERVYGDYGLKNTDDFDNLWNTDYWSGTDYSPTLLSYAWNFKLIDGRNYYSNKSDGNLAIAVRPGEVYFNPVPIPGAVWLLGSGLVGLVGFRKKMKK